MKEFDVEAKKGLQLMIAKAEPAMTIKHIKLN